MYDMMRWRAEQKSVIWPETARYSCLRVCSCQHTVRDCRQDARECRPMRLRVVAGGFSSDRFFGGRIFEFLESLGAPGIMPLSSNKMPCPRCQAACNNVGNVHFSLFACAYACGAQKSAVDARCSWMPCNNALV